MQHTSSRCFEICAVFHPRVLCSRLVRFTGAASPASSTELSAALGATVSPILQLSCAQAPEWSAKRVTKSKQAQDISNLKDQMAQLLEYLARQQVQHPVQAPTLALAPAQEPRLYCWLSVLMERASKFLQVPWTAAPEPCRSVFRIQASCPTFSPSQHSQIYGIQGQALGRSLASLVVARRQLWLSQARVPNVDKSALLDTLISPGHTFRLAMEEILQRSHRGRESSRQVASMLPPQAPVQDRTRRWQPPMARMVTRMVPVPSVPHGNLRHRLQASTADNSRAHLQQHFRRQFHCSRQPPQQAPPQPQQRNMGH
ncbi:UNVERIFIED_CONTAM: hypothetical protein FKN15_056784 [Acipenser sinensis]